MICVSVQTVILYCQGFTLNKHCDFLTHYALLDVNCAGFGMAALEADNATPFAPGSKNRVVVVIPTIVTLVRVTMTSPTITPSTDLVTMFTNCDIAPVFDIVMDDPALFIVVKP